jgi:ribosomal protein S6--L-glutamate ligase
VKRVAVIGVPGGWSSEGLADALAEISGFRALVDLAKVRLDLSTGQAYYQDLELNSLDGLAVKKVGRAYSPKLLDRLEILRVVAQSGVRIFSPPESIVRVLNRLSCTVSLKLAGMPIPPTVVTENPEQAARAVESFGQAVLKPLFTSKARGMLVLEAGPTLREDIENYQAYGNDLIFIQKLLDLPGQDLGLVFMGGKYLTTYARVGREGAWNTTTASGGRYQPYQPAPEVIELARRAQQIFNLDFTCVDVAETSDGPVIFEVSAFGGFRGLKEGCGLDAARLYADYIMDQLER